MFHRLRVELKEVCRPRLKDKGVELLLSVDPVEEKPGQKYIITLIWLICLNQRWSGKSIRANTNKHNYNHSQKCWEG